MWFGLDIGDLSAWYLPCQLLASVKNKSVLRFLGLLDRRFLGGGGGGEEEEEEQVPDATIHFMVFILFWYYLCWYFKCYLVLS